MEKEKKKYKVMIYNFGNKNWDILRLVYDPRTGKRGLAIYDTKEEAEYTKIAEAMAGETIKLKLI